VAGGKRTAADLGAWLIFEDESGQGLRPPTGRTWGRRGHTPVVTVTGAHNSRVSLAALIAMKPGCRPRLIYRVHRSRAAGKDRRKGFTETGYAQLLDAAHQQLGGPLVLVWDNLNTHLSAAMTELIAARERVSSPPSVEHPTSTFPSVSFSGSARPVRVRLVGGQAGTT
jgi:putative transposase